MGPSKFKFRKVCGGSKSSVKVNFYLKFKYFFCKPTFVRLREIFARFARVLSSRKFLAANQSVYVNVIFFQILIFIDCLNILQYQLHMVIYLTRQDLVASNEEVFRPI